MTTNKSLRTDETVQGNLLHDYERKFANLPDHLQFIKLCSTVGTHDDCGDGTLFHDPRRCGTGKIGEVELMSRVHFPSRRPFTRSERMHSWEHEDRSSFGDGCCSSSRTLRNRDHDPILIEWWNLFLGNDREWNQQIRDEMAEETQDDQAEDHSYIATAAERQRRENTWVLMLNSSGTDPWIKEEIMRRPRKFVNVKIKNLAKLTTDFILENKFDLDQTNHLLGTTKVWSASTRRQAGSGTTHSKHQALLPRGGNSLRGGSLPHCRKHQNGMSDPLPCWLKPFWFKPFLVRTCTVLFPFTSFSGFVLSKCLQPCFAVSHLFSWQVLMMGPMCLSLLCLVPLRIVVLLMVPALISTEWVTAQSMHSSRSSILLPLTRGFAEFDKHVKSISEAVGAVTSRITSVWTDC